MQILFSTTLSAQPGTVTFIISASCVPGECGDGSTNFDLLIGDITLERQSIQNTTLKYAGRFPNFQISTPLNNVPLSIVTQYQTFGLPLFLSYNLFPSTTIISVTPNIGQRGTNVTITADDALLSSSALALSRVRLGDTDADIISNSGRVIQVQARSGSAGDGDILINTTQTIGSVTYNGPYTHLENGWTQLSDGNITEIVPRAAQLGRNIFLCGNDLLGNGTSIAVVQHGTNTLLQQQSSPSAPPLNLPASECLEVQVPFAVQDITEENIITITSDTGAIVTSVPNFLISTVSSLSPSRGQAGTIVTIRGQSLLSGYTTMPTVFLSDVLAEVLQWDNSEVVVRAGTPIPQVPVIGILGNISIEVTSPFDSNSRFNVSDDSVWQYEDLGVIDMVMPSFGQFGTLITVTGTNLLAYGNGLTHAMIGDINATIVDGASNSMVQLIVPDTNGTDIVDVTLFSDTGANVRGSRIFQYMEKGVVLSASPSQGQRGTFGKCN